MIWGDDEEIDLSDETEYVYEEVSHTPEELEAESYAMSFESEEDEPDSFKEVPR